MVRRMRGAKMRIYGVWGNLIGQRFFETVEWLGMTGHAQRFEKLNCGQFRRPIMVPSVRGDYCGNTTGQRELF